MHNNPINSGVQKRRFALLLHAGYGDVAPLEKQQYNILTGV
jgi:hypothetical protein